MNRDFKIVIDSFAMRPWCLMWFFPVAVSSHVVAFETKESAIEAIRSVNQRNRMSSTLGHRMQAFPLFYTAENLA